jgi:putative transposase
MRTIMDGIVYVLRNGIPWRALPSDFPPWATVYAWHRTFVSTAFYERLNHAMVVVDRERCGREPSPSAAVVDSQTVKATEAPAPRGYDGGKKTAGLKIHLLGDSDGRVLTVAVSTADLHDSVAFGPLLRASRRTWPFVEIVWADSAYRGERVANAVPAIRVVIVTGPPNQRGFIVQKRRWVVERTFGWIGRFRRLKRVWDVLVDVFVSSVYAASAFMLVRRVAGAAA